VAEQCLVALTALTASGLDSYLSIKLPALRFDRELLAQVVDRASQHGIRLHCDSHGLETADQHCALIQSVLDHQTPTNISTTLPGRWARSVADADWAIERGLIVRVVKGQWPDPADPTRDLRAGYLQVIDRLAGRARHVAVASHDVPLAAEAISRLRAAGTSCELELLYGLPTHQSLRMARQLGVGARVYIPYGQAYLPYALSRLRGNPRMMWWLMKDLMTAKRGEER
jgi:proline dehydrogenase